MTTPDSLIERPKVTVRGCTANTCEIIISTNSGDVRILAGHEGIIVHSQSASGVEIEVQP